MGRLNLIGNLYYIIYKNVDTKISGKNSKFESKRKGFNISTNHLHYNKTAVDTLMASNVAKISILRNPESQFMSSFKERRILLNFLKMTSDYIKSDLLKVLPRSFSRFGDSVKSPVAVQSIAETDTGYQI